MLSEEQKQFMKDNLNIRYTILKKNTSYIDSDIMQEAALGMCKAIEKYESSKSKFSGYASQNIIWAAKRYSRMFYKQVIIKKKLRKFYYLKSYEENLEFKECNIKNILKSLDKRSQKIMILYCLKGKTFREIAPLFNITFQRVEQIYKKSLEKLK